MTASTMRGSASTTRCSTWCSSRALAVRFVPATSRGLTQHTPFSTSLTVSNGRARRSRTGIDTGTPPLHAKLKAASMTIGRVATARVYRSSWSSSSCSLRSLATALLGVSRRRETRWYASMRAVMSVTKTPSA